MNRLTGMMAGRRYSIENVRGAPEFAGFFLDDKYFLHPELLTAIGWLDGDHFIYDQLSSTGEFAFPGGVAGTIKDLTLTLGDGRSLTITELETAAQPEGVTEQTCGSADELLPEKRPNPAFLFATTAATVMAGYIIGRLLKRRRDE
ncbi:short chain dehydrogenase [Pseudomonas sp. NPDC088368]|uniref:short chain dehydrogenase n=1 Tax=Pseudomonas sp. NPDC088368 TaxID=3364453 RepID=UPI0037FF68A5